jgi:hypothetical protein
VLNQIRDKIGSHYDRIDSEMTPKVLKIGEGCEIDPIYFDNFVPEMFAGSLLAPLDKCVTALVKILTALARLPRFDVLIGKELSVSG